VTDPRTPKSDTAFLGHPSGLGWLAFTEFWERFSYYGMQALLVLYMTHQLLTPEHVGRVLGFDPFQHLVAHIYGAATGQALASHIFGLYTSLVYLTPIAGGYLADRFFGRANAVITGASLMALGHFLMAFDASFLLALLCLLIGVGFFKGNIASQVGELYEANDRRRGDAFQLFTLAIQIAVVASPFVCGTLGETLGWHWGFGAAGIGMVIGLVTYVVGRHALPKEASRATRDAIAAARPPLTGADRKTIGVLVALLPVLAIGLVGNQQIFNAYVIWAEKTYRLTFFGFKTPVTWLLSLDAAISFATMVGSIAFWRWWSKKRTEPDEITKIAIGVSIAALAPLLLAVASKVAASSGGRVSIAWGIGFHVINDIGFANVMPISLALYSRAAPKGLTGIIIGILYLHYFMGNMFVGWVGGLLETMPATTFWLLHVGLMLGAATVLLVVRFAVGKILAPSYGDA
jgi:POT family proton-dependent oligopeptide transporter